MNNQPDIYFHVGMGKVASKYLQYEVFPKLQGVCYVPTAKFYKAGSYIEKNTCHAYLLSREFDQQLEREVKLFSQKYPETKAIIIFRHHDSWIASQYRRFAKNGFEKPFSAFIDTLHDTGRFKMKDLQFYQNIEVLETYFRTKPLVLFYDDLLADPFAFIDTIAAYTHTTYHKAEISVAKKHTSYDEKQIKFMQQVRRYIPYREKKYSKNKILFFFQRIPALLFRYSILYTARIIPGFMISKKDLIPKEELEKIRLMHQDDWDKCRAYAAKNNP